MKVVHAAKFYPPVRGGMETVLGDLCDGTAGEWDVTVVAANQSARTVRERCGGVDVVRVAAYGQAASVPLCPTLPWHLWMSRADCVVLHEPNPIAGTALWMRTPARRAMSSACSWSTRATADPTLPQPSNPTCIASMKRAIVRSYRRLEVSREFQCSEGLWSLRPTGACKP